MTDVNDFLEHYGVKGMRWGRRKARSRPADHPNRTRGKNWDQLKDRFDKEKKLKALVREDLYPGRVRATAILKGSGKILLPLIAGTATVIVAKSQHKAWATREAGKVWAEMRGLPSGPTYSLVYDAAKGAWG